MNIFLFPMTIFLKIKFRMSYNKKTHKRVYVKVINYNKNMATTSKDLLPFCRYYKGEKECPKGINANFWEYEKIWVELSENPKEESDGFKMISDWLDDYMRANLTSFDNDDGVPVTLKALLFNRYTHWMQTNDGFKEWYAETYKQEKE